MAVGRWPNPAEAPSTHSSPIPTRCPPQPCFRSHARSRMCTLARLSLSLSLPPSLLSIYLSTYQPTYQPISFLSLSSLSHSLTPSPPTSLLSSPLLSSPIPIKCLHSSLTPRTRVRVHTHTHTHTPPLLFFCHPSPTHSHRLSLSANPLLAFFDHVPGLFTEP